MAIAIWEGTGSELCNYIQDRQKRRHREVTSERERRRKGERSSSRMERSQIGQRCKARPYTQLRQRSCHRTPDGIKRTVGRCMPMHSLCCVRTRMHVYTYITTLPRRVQRRCNAPRSTAPGWLISCRAFHVTVSLLSRLCHFTASTHAHACPAPQTRAIARTGIARARPRRCTARAKQIAL